MAGSKTSLTLGTEHFRAANERVNAALEVSDTVELNEVFAQRYLGSALPEGKSLLIDGTPGNDLGCYMDGGYVEVFGNAQDQIGNTMNAGKIVVHGRCGDAAGYAMRGGAIFVRDDCGWRVGIHMKQYESKCPCVVIGGNAGSFLGEYLAGGVILLMGTAGEYLATGMHGGVVYLRNKLEDYQVLPGLEQVEAGDEDKAVIHALLSEYNEHFADELDEPVDDSGEGFWCLRPLSAKPYAAMYTN